MRQVYFEERTAQLGEAVVRGILNEEGSRQERHASVESDAHRVLASDRDEDVGGFRSQVQVDVDFRAPPFDYAMKARRMRAIQDEREPEVRIATSILGMLRRLGGEFGPYLMLEILLPGGTLLALLLFLHRRKSTVLCRTFGAAVTGRWAPWLFDSIGRYRIRVQTNDMGRGT